jgi:hypothetical protein
MSAFGLWNGAQEEFVRNIGFLQYLLLGQGRLGLMIPFRPYRLYNPNRQVLVDVGLFAIDPK